MNCDKGALRLVQPCEYRPAVIELCTKGGWPLLKLPRNHYINDSPVVAGLRPSLALNLDSQSSMADKKDTAIEYVLSLRYFNTLY